MSVMQLRVGWASLVLGYIQRPLTLNNMVSMVAWASAEGGGVGTENEAHFNPLNTSQRLGLSYPINVDGVQSYARQADGLTATAVTLDYPAYAAIMECLANSTTPLATADAIGSTPWGTPGELVAQCIDEAAQAVAQYWTTEADMLFIKEPNGQVYWFIAAGAASYWRLVPPEAAPMLPASWLVVDDGTWLALWKVGA